MGQEGGEQIKGTVHMGTSLFSNSKHFTLQELAKGVFAAIAIDGGVAICNAGVVDLGGQ